MTGITLDDIRRAAQQGGDLTLFAELYRQCLGAAAVQGKLEIDRTSPLPDPWSSASMFDPGLTALLNGKSYISAPAVSAGYEGLALAVLPPCGQFSGRCLEELHSRFQPDVLVIDTRPFQLGAAMLYALSPACAVGVPAQAEITYADSGQLYESEYFLPGNLNETALVLGWREKIPLVPAGPPGRPLQPEIYSQHGYLYDAYFWARWQSALDAAWRELDGVLERFPGLEQSPGLEALEHAAESIGLNLMEGIGDEMDRSLRGSLRKESCYIASRLLDLAGFYRERGRRARILALIDIVHYTDVREITALFRSGQSIDLFIPAEISRADEMLITGRKRMQPDKERKTDIPADSLARRLFRQCFSSYTEALNRQKLKENEIYTMIAAIASRLRAHPDIARGVSVRGSIALDEVLRGFAEINQSLTRESLLKAALVTLPPRLALKLKGDETALVRDIVKEVLYGFHFSAREFSPAVPDDPGRVSTDEILESLNQLEPLPPGEKRKSARGQLPAVLAENETRKADLRYLESLDLIKKDRNGMYSFTQKALDRMLNELERRISAGEISQQDYEKQKARLSAMMKNLKEPQYQLSDRDRATTVMEMLDAQDKSWNSGVNFNLMHLYYHVKQTSEGTELSQQKRDYYALGRLIDDFARQQMLKKAADKDSGFVLTGMALDMLFRYLMNGHNQPVGIQGLKAEGQDPGSERKLETRRYSAGDAFRDISIRHTLKALAKQKRSLKEIRNHDLRVYLKQTRRPQSDIAICIDTSGSMGFHHELIYARLVAAGLVQAAIRNRDRVGLVAFNDYSQISLPLMEKTAEPLIDCIAGLSIRGNTNIGEGLKCAAEILFRDRNENQKYIILVTDGQPTALSAGVFTRLQALKDRDLTEESALLEARQAAARGAIISVIHIAGPGGDGTAFISNIARIGRGTVRRLSSAGDLRVVLR